MSVACILDIDVLPSSISLSLQPTLAYVWLIIRIVVMRHHQFPPT